MSTNDFLGKVRGMHNGKMKKILYWYPKWNGMVPLKIRKKIAASVNTVSSSSPLQEVILSTIASPLQETISILCTQNIVVFYQLFHVGNSNVIKEAPSHKFFMSTCKEVPYSTFYILLLFWCGYQDFTILILS